MSKCFCCQYLTTILSENTESCYCSISKIPCRPPVTKSCIFFSFSPILIPPSTHVLLHSQGYPRVCQWVCLCGVWWAVWTSWRWLFDLPWSGKLAHTDNKWATQKHSFCWHANLIKTDSCFELLIYICFCVVVEKHAI